MASEDSVVVSAPSVEEAVIIGLTRLTATRDEVDIEVLDEGNKGFLGLGARQAEVRLTRRPKEASATLPTSAASQGAVSEVREKPSSVESTPSPLREPAATTPKPPKPESATPPVQKATPQTRQPKKAERAAPKSQPDDGLDRDRLEAIGHEIIENLTQGLEVDAKIEWLDEERPTLWVSVDGRDADSLVGPRARNLHSLQYLFRALIYHKHDGNYNVVVDADGYRRRRRRSLESLAEKKADQAVEQGKTVRLRAMPAHERRIIHIVLRKDARVTTESVGRGRNRAVTIIPQGADTSPNNG